MSEERILEASRWLTANCGCYPDAISFEDGQYSFEVKPTRIATDAFPHDEDAGFLYEMIRTEISGDEDGWYEEAVLYCQAPAHERQGSIVEGLYSRKIETEPSIQAEFHGTLRFTTPETHASCVQQAEQAHYRRTREQLKADLEHYLGAYSRTVAMIKRPEPDPDLERKIIDALRMIAAGSKTDG